MLIITEQGIKSIVDTGATRLSPLYRLMLSIRTSRTGGNARLVCGELKGYHALAAAAHRQILLINQLKENTMNRPDIDIGAVIKGVTDIKKDHADRLENLSAIKGEVQTGR